MVKKTSTYINRSLKSSCCSAKDNKFLYGQNGRYFKGVLSVFIRFTVFLRMLSTLKNLRGENKNGGRTGMMYHTNLY